MVGFEQYSGPACNFPPMDQWKSLQEIFDANKPEMLQTGNTTDDVNRIWNAVRECATVVGVDERLVLAIVMQESTGNVGVRTTINADGHGTAGLMQCDGSPGFPNQHGLSQEQITSMVRAGTLHYKANLQEHGDGCTAECFYKALRSYNSGSCNPDDLSDGRGATPHYVSDIVNRLLGRRPY